MVLVNVHDEDAGPRNFGLPFAGVSRADRWHHERGDYTNDPVSLVEWLAAGSPAQRSELTLSACPTRP